MYSLHGRFMHSSTLRFVSDTGFTDLVTLQFLGHSIDSHSNDMPGLFQDFWRT